VTKPYIGRPKVTTVCKQQWAVKSFNVRHTVTQQAAYGRSDTWPTGSVDGSVLAKGKNVQNCKYVKYAEFLKEVKA
jgi:hypothetical protein